MGGRHLSLASLEPKQEAGTFRPSQTLGTVSGLSGNTHPMLAFNGTSGVSQALASQNSWATLDYSYPGFGALEDTTFFSGH